MRILRISTFTLIFCLAAQTMWAQSFYARRSDRKITAQAGIAIASFYGETRVPGSIFQKPHIGIDAGLQYHFHNHFAARSNLRYFLLRGDDALSDDAGDEGAEWRVNRNLSFQSHNVQLTFEGMAMLFPESSRYYQRSPFNAYAVAGVGLMYFNPTAVAPETYNGTPLEEGGQRTSLRKLETEGESYGPFALTYQGGLGVELEITQSLDIMVEGIYNFTTTDYLDDVSNRYPGADFFDDPLAAAMSDRGPEVGAPPVGAGKRRGNPDSSDGFFLMMVKVDYWIPQGGMSRQRGPRRRAPRRR